MTMAMIAEDRREDEAVARAIRAQIEYQDFLFIVFPDGVHCLSLATDKEYLIKDGYCNCPDATYTAHPNNFRCKHEAALELAQAKGECN